MLKLENLGEFGFLDKLSAWIKTRNPRVKVGIGDDALVLTDGTIVSSDAYTEDIHFSQRYFSPEEIGFKTAGATLSDLAAMGAEPVCLLVNLFAPPDIDVEFIRRIYAGVEELTGPLGAEIAGGDTVAAKKITLSYTALGFTDKPILRSTARPGHLLYVSGFPGLSAVGQLILGMLKKKEGFNEARQKHLRPEPRIGLGIRLRDTASACVDLSDGLSTDAVELSKASKVKLIIEYDRLPAHPEVASYTERFDQNWDSLVLNGGEDFELLFTSADELPSEITGMPVHRIGSIEEGEGAFLEIDEDLKPLLSKGYDHFNV
ncbi:thiamine-phosphate kinase [candidate division WOR-3 bacterium]|uniref:Thiamine-monophosphate kinase n=1 Tax=candidate division WOR-3 bacterium TaxID=2052148 RepID=A0A9D5KAC9_UNCW3|nr:thiamine-phosphate kinase [candidate division WOR-3 bacterium]MBD3364495.1 thiamine-phosphate kinase [candidate division WOR-3 bacterium]